MWVRGLIITDITAVQSQYQKTIVDMERLVETERRKGNEVGAKRALDELKSSYDQFNSNLKIAATKAAEIAEKVMKEKLDARKRPPTGSVPALRDLVEAAPLSVGGFQTGAVGVGNVEQLNRAINTLTGYGPYWRAIEYGTGQGEVRSQIGRILLGSFDAAGGGDPTPPMAQYAGGAGPHPVFLSAKHELNGGNVGLGTIRHEIEAKHFIKYGADEATVDWRAEILGIQTRTIDELVGIKLPTA